MTRLALLMGTLAAAAVVGRGVAHAKENVFFPLMAWDYAGDEQTIKDMADCGINMIAFVPEKMLDACARHGMRAILYDARIGPKTFDSDYDGDAAARALPDLIKRVNEHPAVFGYHLRDEPDPSMFAELAEAAEVIRKLAPGKWPYINLLPGYGDDYIRDTLEPFIEVCKPPILSYAYYALGEDGGFNPWFWWSLADVSRTAQRYSLPFYKIVLTVAHWGYREPTAADLRLQVFGALAYGARGVCYYKFCSRELPIMNAPDLGNWRMGPLDPFGERTRTWYDLRLVNRQVRNLAPYLLELRRQDVYHVGEVPDRNHGPNERTLIKTFKQGQQWLVGDFAHEDGSRWALVVNKDLRRSAFCQPEFNVLVKSIQYVSPVSGELRSYPFPWFALAPGQGVLLRLECDPMRQ